MKKSLRLLFATIVMAAAMAAATTSGPNTTFHSGADPVPYCPPGGCAVN